MKYYFYGLTFLGGTVELIKMHKLLQNKYPNCMIITKRGQRLLQVSLPDEMLGNDQSVKAEISVYIHSSGFVISVCEADSTPEMIRRIWDDSDNYSNQYLAYSSSSLELLANAYDARNVSELMESLHSKESRERIREVCGINLLEFGLDNYSVSIMFLSKMLVESPGFGDSLPEAGTQAGSKNGELWVVDDHHYWTPQMNEALYWDMFLLIGREHISQYIRNMSYTWMGINLEQLDILDRNLTQSNANIWEADRDDIEHMDINFHRFTNQMYPILLEFYNLSLRTLDLRILNQYSKFEQNVMLTEKAIAEVRSTVERMTRPLDFREFYLLKSGVEEVEARIMLLTVLLVIMEFFAQAVEPGDWNIKWMLLGLIILIPGSYILWGIWHRRKLHRKSVLIGLLNKREALVKEMGVLQEQLSVIEASDMLIEPVLEEFKVELNNIRLQLQGRIDSIDKRISKL